MLYFDSSFITISEWTCIEPDQNLINADAMPNLFVDSSF